MGAWSWGCGCSSRRLRCFTSTKFVMCIGDSWVGPNLVLRDQGVCSLAHGIYSLYVRLIKFVIYIIDRAQQSTLLFL